MNKSPNESPLTGAQARFKQQAEALRSLDDLRGKEEVELVQLFIGACASVENIQRQVLMDIIQRNAETEFGKAHGFASMNSVEDFRLHVPMCEWADFESYAHRMEYGETDLLFAGQPAHFISTSGTTGKFKNIPESDEGDFAKSLVSRIRTALLIKMEPDLLDGFFIPLANVSTLGQTACGIPVGFASGLTLAGTSPDILRRMAFPVSVFKAPDTATIDYLRMRYALAKPKIRLLVGNNPGSMKAMLETVNAHRDRLITDIEQGTLSQELPLERELRAELEHDLSPDPERAKALRDMVAAKGQLEPRDYWPNLSMISCWLGGSIGRYLESLLPLLPENVMLVDCGYGASEGKFNLPMTPGGSAAPLAIQSYFFEFQPMSGGTPVMAHELKDGEEYNLLITSYSGLYRYQMHDIVGVKGFTGQNPNIQFVSKTRDIANIAGEKLSGAFLSDVVRQTLAARQLHWRHFCVVADSKDHRYIFCIEPEGKAPDADWLYEVNQALIAQVAAYQLKHEQQQLIQNPRLMVMAAGWMDQLYAERLRPGGNTSQIKLPVVCEEVPLPDMIGQIIDLP